MFADFSARPTSNKFSGGQSNTTGPRISFAKSIRTTTSCDFLVFPAEAVSEVGFSAKKRVFGIDFPKILRR